MQPKYLFPVSYFTCVQDGLSPVYTASWNGHTEVVDLLVQAGADIHLATTKVHVSTRTLSSSVAAVVVTNVRLSLCMCVRVCMRACVSVCLSTDWCPLFFSKITAALSFKCGYVFR